MPISLNDRLVQIKNNDPSLTTFELFSQKINYAQAKELAAALKHTISLTKLKLLRNIIEKDGNKELTEALKHNSSITDLFFSENTLEDDGAAQDWAEALRHNSSITHLSFKYLKLDNDAVHAWAEFLKNNTHLTTLDFRSNSLGDDGTKYLANALNSNKTLNILNLWQNQIGDSGAKELAKALKNNNSLSSLGLRENLIIEYGAKKLAKSLKHNNSLTTLVLTKNNIGDAGVKYLAEALKVNNTLSTLDISCGEISKVGAKYLAEALKINNNLSTLDVSGNKIDDDGIKYLAKALKSNKSLSILNVSENMIFFAKCLADALKINNSLNTLNISQNSIDNDEAIYLINSLTYNYSLTSVDLANHHLNGDFCDEISKDLKNNYSLVSLKWSFSKKSNEINSYLERNKKIAAILSPFNALEKISIINDFQFIENCLEKLSGLFPDIQEFPSDSYLGEACRLLHALWHSGSYDTEHHITALHLLLTPFSAPAFQQLADRTLGFLLMGSLSATLENKDLLEEGLLLSLYAFRNQLHLREVKPFVQIAFFKLAKGLKKNFGFEEQTILGSVDNCSTTRTTATCRGSFAASTDPVDKPRDVGLSVKCQQVLATYTPLLGSEELRSLLNKALVSFSALDKNKPSAEANLIQSLLQSKAVNVFSLPTACQSKAFINAFRAQYPKAQYLTTIGHCLLTAANGGDLFLIDTDAAAKQSIDNDDVQKYTKQMSGWKFNKMDKNVPLTKVVRGLKRTLKKAFPLAETDSAPDGYTNTSTDYFLKKSFWKKSDFLNYCFFSQQNQTNVETSPAKEQAEIKSLSH